MRSSRFPGMGLALVVASAMGIAAPRAVLDLEDDLDDEPRRKSEEAKRLERELRTRRASPKMGQPPAPKVHKHSREIARRLRQEERRASK